MRIILIMLLVVLGMLFKSYEYYTNLIFIAEINPEYVTLSFNVHNNTLKDQIRNKFVKVVDTSGELKFGDAYMFSIENNKDARILTMISSNKRSFLMIKPSQRGGDRYGYLNDEDNKLLRTIYYGEELNTKKVILGKSIDLTVFDKNNIDILVLFVDLNEFEYTIDKSFKYEFIDYEGLFDFFKLKVLIPSITGQNVDLSKTFKNRRDVLYLYQFDMMIYGDKRLINDKRVSLTDVYNRFNDEYVNNYYKRLFKFYDISEEFIDIDAKGNIDGYYDAKNKVLRVKDNYIDDIPVTDNDRVILNNQRREEENGIYIWKNNALKKIYEDKYFDYHKYECSNDPSIQIKALCESSTGINGLPKEPGIWDRRCIANTDCPFYQINNNYMGGCLDGYCQMPIGIKRIGYRYYDKNSKPLCHGCLGENCCDKQNYAFELDDFERFEQYFEENSREYMEKILDSKKKRLNMSIILTTTSNMKYPIVTSKISQMLLGFFKEPYYIVKDELIHVDSGTCTWGQCYMYYTQHIMHRESKKHGFDILLYTLYFNGNYYMLNYKINELMSEDKVFAYKEVPYDSDYINNNLKRLSIDRGLKVELQT